MEKNLSRKQFLRTGTKYAAGFAVGATVLGGMDLKGLGASAKFPEWPWPYSQVDPEVARIYGHDAFWSGKGCSYGAFHGVIQTLRDAVGEPFTTFPDEIMLYGYGGGVGWGGTCGAINGAGAAISLVSDKATTAKLVSELYGWYTLATLPTDTSNDLGANSQFGENKLPIVLPQNTSHSPLCHASVTMWCNTAGKKESDMERKERCARLTGDVSAYAVMLLNDELNSQFTPLYTTPESVTECMACHGTAMIDNVASKMECQSCHGDPHATSGVRQIDTLALSFTMAQNYPNPFNPSTTIKFSIPKGETVQLQIFDAHGRRIATLVNEQHMAPGTYEVTWNGLSDTGIPITSGTYFARVIAGKASRTRKMIMMK